MGSIVGPLLVAPLLVLGACTSTAPDAAPAVPSSGSVPASRPAPPATAPSAIEGIGDDGALPDIGTRAIDVDHYDLALRWDPARSELTGTATIEARAVVTIGETDQPTIELDLQPFTIDEVTVDGVTARSTHRDAKLAITPPARLDAGRDFTVVVDYHGEPDTVETAALPGVSVGWQHGRSGSMTLSEPDGAKSWFPVNDHPLDKATYAMSVTVPRPLVAVANGRLVSTDDAITDEDGAGARTFRWRMDAPMASYLATVVTGPLVPVEPSEHDGVDYSSWVLEGEDDALVDELADAPSVVRRLAERLGPFPFATYGSIVYDDSFLTAADAETRSFLDGVALETQGRSLYARAAVVPATMIHETAHQWFGNSVSITDWSDDIWWVEGFASFAEVALAPGVGAELSPTRFRSSYERCDGRSVDDLPVADLFSDRSYRCGALVFYALHEEVGDETFWRIMRAFQDRHRHANASTQDLIDTASDVAGRDLEPFLRSWISGARPPWTFG